MRFGAFGPPGIAAFGPAGQEVAPRFVGHHPLEPFLAPLDRADALRAGP